MSEFRNTELRRLDLTLLLVFLGLLRHRKALDVAGDLGLTQSAISQALRRLREIFADELFLRRPHGMEPTAVALALEAPVARAVEALRGAVGLSRQFDPQKAAGVLRIAALDAEQAVILPPLFARLRETAPALRLSVLPLGRADAVDALIEGRVDFALGFLWNTPEVIVSDLLYDEGFLVAGRPGSLPDPLDLDAYCAADHILVSLGGDLRGVVDEHLELLGRTRRIALGLPAFLPALAAASTSGALVTLPTRIARTHATGFGLAIAEPPISVRRFPVSVFWHRRNDQDPRTRWFQDSLHQAVATA